MTWWWYSLSDMVKVLEDWEVTPRVNPYCHLRAREGADGQAVVCPLLRGSSPTRWVAPKQHWPPALTPIVTYVRARALMARQCGVELTRPPLSARTSKQIGNCS